MQRGDQGDLWVFGYGSLMWNPGFEYVERRLARLDGYRRRFTLTSRHYRGTPERPGLVLGLDWAPDENCAGIAYRVCPSKDGEVRDYLAERELVSYAYFETRYPVTFDDGGRVEALCYVVDRSHAQYAGGLDIDEQARIIAEAVGPSGPNLEYLENTLTHLAELGISDRELEQLALRARAFARERP